MGMTFQHAALAVVLSVATGELLKVVRQLIKKERIKAFGLGGFVSTHSAAVSSLILAVYFETGLSILLLACAVFGAIVLRDAYGVRWEVSRHSVALNKLTGSEQFSRAGHQKKEVLLGVGLGLLVTGIIYWLF